MELGAVGFGESTPLTESGRPLRPFVRPYIAGLSGESSFGIAAVLPFLLPLLLIPPCTGANRKRSNYLPAWVKALERNGAGDGTRTHDVQLGKLAFYH